MVSEPNQYVYPEPIDAETGEDVEGFEVLIDEAWLCVVRCNGKVAAQVHSPVDMSELAYRLAEEGYVATEMMCYEDGVLELLLRELGNVPEDVSEFEAERMAAAANYIKEREAAYA